MEARVDDLESRVDRMENQLMDAESDNALQGRQIKALEEERDRLAKRVGVLEEAFELATMPDYMSCDRHEQEAN